VSINIIGSSLSALIAVLKISETSKVNWVLGDNRVGGHFAGLKSHDQFFDLGMVLLEPFETYSGIEPDLSTYMKPIRHNSRELVPFAFSWLEKKGFIFDEVEIKTFFQNDLISDFYIGDSLNLLSNLSIATKAQIMEEINFLGISSDSDLHPVNKLTSNEYKSKTFKNLTELVLGKTYLNEVILPWANMFFPEISSYISAVEHRAAWLPMYYPESIKEALGNPQNVSNIPAKKFVAPRLKSVSQLVADLKDLCLTNPRVTVVNQASFNLHSQQNASIFLGNESELSQIIDTSKSEITTKLDQGKIHNSEISILIFHAVTTDLNEFTINVCDDPRSIYRISKRIIDSKLNTRLSIEIGNTERTEESVLIAAGFVGVNTFVNGDFEFVKLVRTKFKVGDPVNIEFKKNSRTLLENQMREASLAGEIQGSHNSAFNDQLCLGLWYANKATSLGGRNAE